MVFQFHNYTKILNACQNYIVDYTFLNVCEQIYQFLSSIKMMHTEANWFLFSASPCSLVISVKPVISTSTGPIFTKFAGMVELWLKFDLLL